MPLHPGSAAAEGRSRLHTRACTHVHAPDVSQTRLQPWEHRGGRKAALTWGAGRRRGAGGCRGWRAGGSSEPSCGRAAAAAWPARAAGSARAPARRQRPCSPPRPAVKPLSPSPHRSLASLKCRTGKGISLVGWQAPSWPPLLTGPQIYPILTPSAGLSHMFGSGRSQRSGTRGNSTWL